MQSARVWRKDRMMVRLVARLAADRAADAAAQPVRSAVAEPTPMLARARLLNTRHIVPAPQAPLDRLTSSMWIV